MEEPWEKKKGSAHDFEGYTLETDDWYNRADDKVWANVRAFEAGITRFKL